MSYTNNLKEDYFESYIQIGQLFKKLSLLDEAIKIYKLALPKVTQKETINVNISEVYYLQILQCPPLQKN